MKSRPALTIALLVSFAFAAPPGSFVHDSWAQPTVDQLEEQAVQNAVTHVSASVVRIETLGGLEQVDGRLVGTGPTTGLCIAADGYIVSSAYNFVRQPTSILVTLPGGKRAPAQIIARDHSRMLVVLKVDTDQKLPVPETSPRSEWSVGQWSIAVGRAYAADAPNVSVGILSATNRIWGRAVQTDAKISPGNYGGPLIDIRGRVIGVLVPLSPQERGVMAGTEWYDSGIGFAIPFEDVLEQLEDLKQGKDLYPGIMGISFKGSDIYSQPATIAACPAKSPAHEGGLRVGDTIVQVNGQKITRRAQLLHALGPLYAGNLVQLVAERGDASERIEVTVKLTDEIEPYIRPFLGILPERPSSSADKGAGIRFVIPDSPASQTGGLKSGERIVAVNDKPLEDATDLRESIARLSPEDEVALKIGGNGQTRSVTIKLGKVPGEIPSELPAMPQADGNQPAAEQPTGTVKISLPEEPEPCTAYVPSDYHPTRPHGLLVWLAIPGQADFAKRIERWKTICDQRDLMLLIPQAHDNRSWLPTEVDYIQKLVDEMLNRYSTDRDRVAICGEGVSGTMAYLVAFGNRTVYRGVASMNGPLPRRLEKPATDPLQPLTIFSLSFRESDQAARIQAGEKALRTLSFPVITRDIPGDKRPVSEQESDELGRWCELLDGI